MIIMTLFYTHRYNERRRKADNLVALMILQNFVLPFWKYLRPNLFNSLLCSFVLIMFSLGITQNMLGQLANKITTLTFTFFEVLSACTRCCLLFRKVWFLEILFRSAKCYLTIYLFKNLITFLQWCRLFLNNVSFFEMF